MNSKSKFLVKLPYPVKLKILEGLRILGSMTAEARLRPDFLIIGAQRCGTSSLYHDLIQHPDVCSALRKEIHFFDIHYQKGFPWYRGHFPTGLSKTWNKGLITGEASPYYIFHPHAPRRIHQFNPSMKLIVLLRNPVDRAYSHYQHEVWLRNEIFSFEEVIYLEPERLRGEKERLLMDPEYQSFNHQHFSYLSRGIYIEQLLNWVKYFKPDQLLIFRSENLYCSPIDTFLLVSDFLGLRTWIPAEFTKLNSHTYPPMDARTRNTLNAYFEPFNKKLYEFLEVDHPWW